MIFRFIFAIRMDSRNSESESVNGAESLLSSSPGAASTSSRERMDSDSSDKYEESNNFFLVINFV